MSDDNQADVLLDLRPQLTAEQACVLLDRLDNIFQGLSMGDALALLAHQYGALVHSLGQQSAARCMQAQMHFHEVTLFVIEQCKKDGCNVEPITAEEFMRRVEAGLMKPPTIPLALPKDKVN